VLDFAGIKHVIEDRSQATQFSEGSGVKFHVMMRDGARWTSAKLFALELQEAFDQVLHGVARLVVWELDVQNG